MTLFLPVHHPPVSFLEHKLRSVALTDATRSILKCSGKAKSEAFMIAMQFPAILTYSYKSQPRHSIRWSDSLPGSV